MRGRERRGVGLVEVLVALLLGLLVVHIALSTVASSRTAQASWTQRSERLATLRIARALLRAELRAGVAGRDWLVSPPDSVRVRSFLGRGIPCKAVDARSDLYVAWQGRRRPDPRRDSVLVLTAAGSWQAVDLLAAAPASAGCPASASGSGEVWRTTLPGGSRPELAVLFVSGSYHVWGGALRYRRGRAGRQPLTPALLTSRSGLTASPAGVYLSLEGRDGWIWNGPVAYRGRRAR